jgi:hypothetical protein
MTWVPKVSKEAYLDGRLQAMADGTGGTTHEFTGAKTVYVEVRLLMTFRVAVLFSCTVSTLFSADSCELRLKPCSSIEGVGVDSQRPAAGQERRAHGPQAIRTTG